MNVLGICGRDRDAAAALSVDGRVVSAAIEESFARVPGIGYAQTSGFPSHAVEAVSLRRDSKRAQSMNSSSLTIPALSSGRPTPARVIDAAEADARHAAMTHPDAGAIVVCGADPPVLAVFTREGSTWARAKTWPAPPDCSKALNVSRARLARRDRSAGGARQARPRCRT